MSKPKNWIKLSYGAANFHSATGKDRSMRRILRALVVEAVINQRLNACDGNKLTPAQIAQEVIP
jgi:hypothetical protein